MKRATLPLVLALLTLAAGCSKDQAAELAELRQKHEELAQKLAGHDKDLDEAAAAVNGLVARMDAAEEAIKALQSQPVGAPAGDDPGKVVGAANVVKQVKFLKMETAKLRSDMGKLGAEVEEIWQEIDPDKKGNPSPSDD